MAPGPIYSGSSCDKPLELPDGLLDSIREMQERWNNRLEREDFDIAEEYLNGRLALFVQLHRASAPFHESGPPITFHLESGALQSDYVGTSWVHHFENTKVRGADNGRDDDVFIRVIERLQSVKVFSAPTFVCSEP